MKNVSVSRPSRIAPFAECLKLFRALEWKGRTQGQGSSMGRNDGTWYGACPQCGGVEPSDWARAEFSKVGHEPRCALAEMIKRLKSHFGPAKKNGGAK